MSMYSTLKYNALTPKPNDRLFFRRRGRPRLLAAAVLGDLVLVRDVAGDGLAAVLGGVLGGLAVGLGLLLLGLGQLGELAAGSDEEAARVPDGQDEEGDHHGEAVEGVRVLLFNTAVFRELIFPNGGGIPPVMVGLTSWKGMGLEGLMPPANSAIR